MAEIDDLWEMAEAALAEARTLPWGPERIEALGKRRHSSLEGGRKAVDHRPTAARESAGAARLVVPARFD
ncbi:MAG TPA: hypothetical protein VD863_07755 [Bradyrhizobium sp.]|jgi:hypothetical protein|nr:hypothetical protein [Bradyrhizobium sp.]